MFIQPVAGLPHTDNNEQEFITVRSLTLAMKDRQKVEYTANREVRDSNRKQK